MKYTIIVFALFFFAACGEGTGETEASDSANATENITNIGGTGLSPDSAENNNGSNLIAAHDCFTCHEIEEKNIGPSYKQIAARYENNQGNIENLANKIIKGGKGLWGEQVMNAHPDINEQQAQEMSRYILSLKEPSDTIK